MKAVNLIPSEHRAVARPAAGRSAGSNGDGKPFGAYVILGALVLAIAAVALLTLTSNSIKENEAELQRVEQESAAISQQAAALQSFADFEQLADTRSETVRGIAASRFQWAHTLEDISRALPADVYMSAFDGTTLGESSGSSLRGAIQAPSIELNGCTRDQASVARLMSRLRDVRGVTRVSLAKSEAIDATESASAPAAPAAASDEASTPSVTTEPCPKGSPPAFDMIVFFERAPVSAAAAPNAGTTAVGAPAGATGPTGPTGASGSTTTTTPASSTSTTP